MKSRFPILIGLLVGFLLLDSTVAQIPSDANLRMEVNNLSETNFWGNVSNTEGDVQYEIQRKQSVTNWVSVGFFYGAETTNRTPFDFEIHGDINPKTILRVRSWKDDGSGLPIWWQLKYFGNTGVDPNGNPAGDGYSNIQKFQNGMNPFTWYMPPKPQIYVQFLGGAGNSTKGSAVITLRDLVGTVPDYFIVERANRQLRRMTNSPYFRSGPLVINGAPNPHPGPLRPDWQNQSPFTTEPFEAVAKIQCQPNVRDYRYVETNVDTFAQPLYRIEPHYSPPLHARLDKIDATTIRGTILRVTAVPTTNGYNLTVPHPIPYARYLLLVRDKNDPQWRASGYFASGTNRSPVFLCADTKGMMSSGQSPIAMPAVKFLPDVVDPEFVAGWGEDSDGDGLPDIYEVLVTHTEPDNPDTGNTGILDGDKKMTGDGWSNTEKFRCRVNPLRLAQPPATIELKQPTRTEILKAVTPKTDLTCELQIEVRTNGATGYQPISQVPWVLLKILDFTQPDDLGNFVCESPGDLLKVNLTTSVMVLIGIGLWNSKPSDL